MMTRSATNTVDLMHKNTTSTKQGTIVPFYCTTRGLMVQERSFYMAKGRPEFNFNPKTGYYRKRIRMPDNTYRDVRAKTKEELRAKLYDLETAVRQGLVLNDKTTVAELAKEWYENRRGKWSYSRRSDYTNAINKHICPVIGAMRVKEIKPEHCQRILANMAGMSNSSQSKVVTTLKQIFDCAEENGLILRSPCARLKAGGERTQEKIPLTPEQCQALEEATRGTKAYLFVMLGLYAGLRREEICGLRWGDVDLTADTPHLTVNNAVRFEGNQGIFPSPLKTPAAHRTIPLPPQLAAALRDAKRTARSVFVIPSSTGSNATKQTVRSIMAIIERRKVKPQPIQASEDKPAKKKPGPKPMEGPIDFDVHAHLLRHTYITRLCQSGMDVKQIQYLAGHATVQMTLNIYCHVTQNRPEQLIGAVEKAFTDSKEAAAKEGT